MPAPSSRFRSCHCSSLDEFEGDAPANHLVQPHDPQKSGPIAGPATEDHTSGTGLHPDCFPHFLSELYPDLRTSSRKSVGLAVP